MLESREDVALVVTRFVWVVADHGDKLGQVEELAYEHVMAVVHLFEIRLSDGDLLVSTAL
jgi:hypothetical protein